MTDWDLITLRKGETVRIVSFSMMMLCILCVRPDGGSGNAQGQATAPGPSVLDQKVAALLPRPDEDRWLQIPWQANLMKARLEAQRAGKPLLIWVMDGNVLGCT